MVTLLCPQIIKTIKKEIDKKGGRAILNKVLYKK
jgi:hypothetical protein